MGCPRRVPPPGPGPSERQTFEGPVPCRGVLRTGIQVRRADTRGTTTTDWLLSRHSFSFAAYRDPQHMGLGPLRVLNDDVVAPGAGFGPHAHRDMEILSYVLEGALEHHDTQGGEGGQKGVLKAGEVQFLRAGTGVVHSEMNASATAPVHFLQVWLVPRTLALKPHYEQGPVQFPARGGWATIASPGTGGFDIDADAVVLTAKIAAGQKAGHVVHGGRMAYAFLIAGQAQLGSETLGPGDAALVQDGIVGLRAAQDCHVLLFDLPRA